MNTITELIISNSIAEFNLSNTRRQLSNFSWISDNEKLYKRKNPWGDDEERGIYKIVGKGYYLYEKDNVTNDAPYLVLQSTISQKHFIVQELVLNNELNAL